MYTSSQVDIHSHKRKTYRETDILTYRQTERQTGMQRYDKEIETYGDTGRQTNRDRLAQARLYIRVHK